ncbi:MAG: menaquinone biosynthesis protein [Candidatus Poseidoniaceae archaeon]|jgi:chorismate dehydratase|nr:menaquinone biosynthesis protein [Candidatus Poseidoniaceae archaeon]
MWKKTIGRVAFINCEPLYYGLNSQWRILSAPPSWLTGHLLRRDCIIAPIPAADYAKYSDELVLVPNLSISSKGEVGSVLLFSKHNLNDVKTIALPSDSATSVKLLKYLLNSRGIRPEYIEMGPDLDAMLAKCDACLLIGDRALNASTNYPDIVKLDLGSEWKENSGYPMVFGVFAARSDTDKKLVIEAHNALLSRLEDFENNQDTRAKVILECAERTNQDISRLEKYFGEVINRMDAEDMDGLNLFLGDVCEMPHGPKLAW